MKSLNLTLSGIVAATLLACGPKIDTFVEGTVLEEHYEAAAVPTKKDKTVTDGKEALHTEYGAQGDVYRLVVETKEGSSETRKYNLLITASDQKNAKPLSELEKAIFPGTTVLFCYRDLDHGTLRFPVDRFGNLASSELYVVEPYENPQQKLDSLNEQARTDYMKKQDAAREQRWIESRQGPCPVYKSWM